MKRAPRTIRDAARQGRLSVRPEIDPKNALEPGLHKIAIPHSRDATFYVPAAADAGSGIPLIVSLHGAGGHAGYGIELLRAQADEHRFAILAPASRQNTWDVIVTGYGPDIMAIDYALDYVFESVHVQPERIAISGFSDGASYALSVGLVNGELFRDILAFSPGFVVPGEWQHRPRIFISHGIHDTVLPIDRCSRKIVPRLRGAGYEVSFQEFDGPHSVPEKVKAAAIDRWIATPAGN